MKTYTNLYEQVTDPATIAICAVDAAKHKTHRRTVMRTLLHMDVTVEKVLQCIKDPDWRPPKHKVKIIIDEPSRKERKIIHPQFEPEQIWHHALMKLFEPIVLHGLYEHVYGNRPSEERKGPEGRKYFKTFGPQQAAKQLAKWAQCGKKVYCFEADIHHAYNSVDLEVLKMKLEKCIRDPPYMNEMEKLFDSMKEIGKLAGDGSPGLPLGFYPSPWLWHFYMKEFDHYAATLGAHYLRYADNIFFVGTNKRKMHRIKEAVTNYLEEKLHLHLKANW